MADRADLYQQFVARFGAGRRLKPNTDEQLDAVETTIGIQLPSSYRAFLTTHGSVWTPKLLDLIVELESETHDVQQFLKPAEVTKTTRDFRKHEMNEGCVLIALDSGGSFFMFRDLPHSGPRPDDAAVWFNDHEFENIDQVAPSFDEWLGQFLRL